MLARRGECRETATGNSHNMNATHGRAPGGGPLSSWCSAVHVVRELAEHQWFSTPGLEMPRVIEQVRTK